MNRKSKKEQRKPIMATQEKLSVFNAARTGLSPTLGGKDTEGL
jgi:hypothetical protein